MYVEKRRVAVRIAQLGRDPIDGFLCVNVPGAATPGAKTILDLLNSSAHVIPFIVSEDGAVRLLTRLNLDWVIAGERVPSELIYPDRPAERYEEPAEIEFTSGSTIDGLIQIDGGGRASDFLNGPADFFPVRTRVGTLLVNRHRVLETRLGTATPVWAGWSTRGSDSE